MSVDDAAVAWLRQQIEADKAAAEAAPGDHWQSFTEDDIAGASVYDEQWVLLYPQRYEHDKPMSNRPGATGPQYIQRSRNELVAHIARHDPQDVIADCEAKLTILAEHGGEHMCFKNGHDGNTWDYWIGDCRIMATLASAYRHREGYAQHWEPVSV